MEESTPEKHPIYLAFLEKSLLEQQTILVEIINRHAGFSVQAAPWFENHARIILGLHAEKKLKEAMNLSVFPQEAYSKLRQVDENKDLRGLITPRYKIDPQIYQFIEDLSNRNSTTIGFLKRKATENSFLAVPFPPSAPAPTRTILDAQESEKRAAGGQQAEASSNNAGGSESEAEAVSDIGEGSGPLLLRGKNGSLPFQSAEESDDSLSKHPALIKLNKAKKLAWTDRNYAQRTGEITFATGGAVALFGIFAGSNTLISTSIANILPKVFSAWAIAHSVPPAALFFYLLGTFVALGGVLTFGAGTVHQLCQRQAALRAG